MATTVVRPYTADRPHWDNDFYDPCLQDRCVGGRGTKPFRRGGVLYNPTHNCPACGRSQYYISGRGPGGTHTHTCSSCSTTWFH